MPTIPNRLRIVRPCPCSSAPVSVYSETFDAYFCTKCFEWVEKACTDPTCVFCRDRPINASLRRTDRSMKTRRQKILDVASDAALRMALYDRRDSEDLPPDAIPNAIADGEITIEEIVNSFRSQLFIVLVGKRG